MVLVKGETMAARRRTQASNTLTLDRLRALAHPLRQRLLLLFAHQRLTTKQAAVKLGESPTKLYHHVAALERAGLVELKATRPNRGTVEKYYEATTRSVRAGRAQVASPAAREAVGTLLFEQARADLLRALDRGKAPGEAAPIALRMLMQLTPAQARRVRAEVLALIERFRAEAAKAPGARTQRQAYAFTAALLPVDFVGDG